MSILLLTKWSMNIEIWKINVDPYYNLLGACRATNGALFKRHDDRFIEWGTF